MLSLILLLMCQFSGETRMKNPPFILFQFCVYVKNAINKCWLTFIPAINILVVYPFLVTAASTLIFKLGNHVDSQAC